MLLRSKHSRSNASNKMTLLRPDSEILFRIQYLSSPFSVCLSKDYISILKSARLNQFKHACFAPCSNTVHLYYSGMCAVYRQLSDLKQDKFDFVVVGG